MLRSAVLTGGVIILLRAVGAPVQAEESSPKICLSLDHVNVAVQDLSPAKQSYRRLGFTVKPGRVHKNSIDNAHLKFSDGCELELITATSPLDQLAVEYLRRIEKGEGGAFLALRCSNLDSLLMLIEYQGHPARISGGSTVRALTFPPGHDLRSLWFVELGEPWIDSGKFITHQNGALRLVAVWLDASLTDALGSLFAVFGYRLGRSVLPQQDAREIRLAAGSIYLVDREVPVKGRAVIGSTIGVSDLSRAVELLTESEVEVVARSDSRGQSVLVAPETAHGVWLEFVEATGDSS